MSHVSTSPPVVAFPRDLTACLRARIRETIEFVLDEELEAALGAARSERTGSRCGYRNGSITRSLLTEHGPQRLTIPRGRLLAEDGSTTEWRSDLVERYARRTRKVDEAIVGVYFSPHRPSSWAAPAGTGLSLSFGKAMRPGDVVPR